MKCRICKKEVERREGVVAKEYTYEDKGSRYDMSTRLFIYHRDCYAQDKKRYPYTTWWRARRHMREVGDREVERYRAQQQSAGVAFVLLAIVLFVVMFAMDGAVEGYVRAIMVAIIAFAIGLVGVGLWKLKREMNDWNR